MRLKNLTPHALVIKGTNGTVKVPPSGDIARVSVSYVGHRAYEMDGVLIPVRRAVYGAVEGLPAPVAGTAYVVSGMVASAVTGRTDVFSPGALVRDAAGKPVACDGLKAAGNGGTKLSAEAAEIIEGYCYALAAERATPDVALSEILAICGGVEVAS